MGRLVYQLQQQPYSASSIEPIIRITFTKSNKSVKRICQEKTDDE